MKRFLVPADGTALRSNNFNAIRLAMAITVVWSHSFALFKGTEDREPISILLGGVVNTGNIAVLVFFVVSGFLISRSFIDSSSAWSYLRKRILRIYPGFLVAVLVCSFIVVPVFSSRSVFWITQDEAWGLASNLALKGYILPSNAFGGGAVNGSLWSIPYEFWCYIGVLVLGLTGFLRWPPTFLLVAGAALAIRVWLDLTGRHPAGVLAPIIGPAYWWFVVLPPFALGGAALFYGHRIPRRRYILLGLIAMLVTVAHLPGEPVYRVTLTRLLLPFLLAYGTLYVAFSSVRTPDPARWGDISYGTYLYAFPIQQMLSVSISDRIGFEASLILSVLLSLLAGTISWVVIERFFVVRRSRPNIPLKREAELAAP